MFDLLGSLDLHVDAQMSSLVQELCSPEGVDDDHKLGTNSPPPADSSMSGGSRILQMLNQSNRSSDAGTCMFLCKYFIGSSHQI